jgi:hypothetical protein
VHQGLLGCLEIREAVEHAGDPGTHIHQLAAVAGFKSLLGVKVLGSKSFSEGLLLGELLHQPSLPGGIQTLGVFPPMTLKTKMLGATASMQTGGVLPML